MYELHNWRIIPPPLVPPSGRQVISVDVPHGIVSSCLAQQPCLWGRNREQSGGGGGGGVNGSVFPDIWWSHSREERERSCSSPAYWKPPLWSLPAAIASRDTLAGKEKTKANTCYHCWVKCNNTSMKGTPRFAWGSQMTYSTWVL